MECSWFGQQMVAHSQQSPEPYSTQQTSRHAVWDSNCQQNPPPQMETRNSNSPPPMKGSHDAGIPPQPISTSTMASRWTQRQSHWVRAPPLDGGRRPRHRQKLERTPQHQTMKMRTSLPSPASKLQPSRPQTCDRSARATPGAIRYPNGQARTGTRRAL